MNLNQTINRRARTSLLRDALYLPLGVSKNGQGASHRRPSAVINEQGFLHYRRVRVKKLVHDSKLRLATWNIGTLTGKGMEIVDTMIRRKVNIIRLQEAKWIGERCRKIENTWYKLYYTEKYKNRNGVGIIVDKNFKEYVVKVTRKGDRIISLKLIIEDNIINIISAYAPQVGLDQWTRIQFWKDLDKVIEEILQGEKIYI